MAPADRARASGNPISAQAGKRTSTIPLHRVNAPDAPRTQAIRTTAPFGLTRHLTLRNLTVSYETDVEPTGNDVGNRP